MALILSVWIMFIAVRLFRETSIVLMDGILEPEIYDKVISAVKMVDGVKNPHRIRIRKMSYMYIVDIDIEVDEDMTVLDSHKLGIEVERNIMEHVKNIYDVMLHIEPIGNVESNERFGVSENE